MGMKVWYDTSSGVPPCSSLDFRYTQGSRLLCLLRELQSSREFSSYLLVEENESVFINSFHNTVHEGGRLGVGSLCGGRLEERGVAEAAGVSNARDPKVRELFRRLQELCSRTFLTGSLGVRISGTP